MKSKYYYGKDHAETGIILSNLSSALESFGDYQKKKDLLIRALEIKEKYSGSDHLETVLALSGGTFERI